MRKRIAFVVCLVAGVLLAGGYLCELSTAPAVAAIPTPVAEVAGGGDWIMVTFSTGGDFTDVYDTATGTAQHVPGYTAADMSWTLDVSGTITVTCTTEFSNDNSNWADGLDLFASKTADETNMNQFNLFGRYTRVKCTETGGVAGQTYTATIIGKLIN